MRGFCIGVGAAVALAGCATGSTVSAPVVWSPAQLRPDAEEAVALTVRNASAQPICALSIGYSRDSLAEALTWTPRELEGGRLAAGAELALQETPGTLVVRAQSCEGRVAESERRVTSPNQRIVVTVERL